MILYQLRCAREHEFEIWFRDGQTCDKQLARGIVECPVCGSKDIGKAIMAPRITRSEGSGRTAPSRQSAEDAAEALRGKLSALRQEVEKNCDYVGDRFAEEARRIHYGETKKRGIYGEATDDQHRELADEGVEVARIPWLPRSDA